MARGHEPEDLRTPRDAFEELESASEQSSRDQMAREQAADDRSLVATQNHHRNGAPPMEAPVDP